MNITEAKNEIINTIKAYLKKDALGRYVIPLRSQRPILLMGAPGIGKTALMEQIARELSLNLVSYSITHHTRQSALGLPFITERDGVSRTNYTVSEIIAEVCDKISETGIKEGILFLDEINCVSETLAPALLRFLQYKYFGTHKLPEGFVVVAAGNPPEYNRSVREFDIVTLDRMKKIDIEPSLDAWLEYASGERVHGSILSYLRLKKDSFYKIGASVDGPEIITARGWEDLSHIIKAYEGEGLPLSLDEIRAYIQNDETARDFAAYYELYKKYERDYRIGEVLKGKVDTGAARRLGYGSFDEKISIIGLLSSGLCSYFKDYCGTDRYVTELFDALKRLKVLCSENSFKDSLSSLLSERRAAFDKKKKAELFTPDHEETALCILDKLSSFAGFEDFDAVREAFSAETAKRESSADRAATALDSAIAFIETAFGKGQEMVLFITSLNMDPYACAYLEEYENEKYAMYNKELLFEERDKVITDRIKDLDLLK